MYCPSAIPPDGSFVKPFRWLNPLHSKWKQWFGCTVCDRRYVAVFIHLYVAFAVQFISFFIPIFIFIAHPLSLQMTILLNPSDDWFPSPQTIITNWHHISHTTKYCNIISIVYRFTLKYITFFFADIYRNCSSAGLSDNSFWTLHMTKSITSQMKLIIWPQYSWKAIHCNTFSFGYSFHLKIYIKYISRYLFELSDSNPFWRHFFHFIQMLRRLNFRRMIT